MSKNLLFVVMSALLVVGTMSCKNEKKQEVKQEVQNPFATPEGCVREYLDAKSKRDMVRMLNCFSYEAKYERLLRESLQESIDKEDGKVRGYTKTKAFQINSVTLKDEYPNSAVVTVDYTETEIDNDVYSGSYDMNLVKDSGNWKLEVNFVYSFGRN